MDVDGRTYDFFDTLVGERESGLADPAGDLPSRLLSLGKDVLTRL